MAYNDQQSGMVLLMVLLWMSLATLSVMSLLTLSREQHVLLRLHEQDEQLFYFAEQGVRCAEAALIDRPLLWCRSLTAASVHVEPLLSDNVLGSLVQIDSIAQDPIRVIKLRVVDKLHSATVQRQSWQQLKA